MPSFFGGQKASLHDLVKSASKAALVKALRAPNVDTNAFNAV